MSRIRTILVPTDFSEPSTGAFRYACALARDNRARLVALHALEPIPPLTADGMLLPTDMNFARSAARDRLRELAPGQACDRLLRDGPAAEVIVRAAEEVGADLIVMGTHGRRGLGRLLLGSVAESVLRHARCPVLFVKHGPPTLESSEAGAGS